MVKKEALCKKVMCRIRFGVRPGGKEEESVRRIRELPIENTSY